MAKLTFHSLPKHLLALPAPRARVPDAPSLASLDLSTGANARALGFKTVGDAEAAEAAGMLPAISGEHLQHFWNNPTIPDAVRRSVLKRVYTCADPARWQPPAVDLTAHAAVPTAKGLRLFPTNVRMHSIVDQQAHDDAASAACAAIREGIAAHRIKAMGPVRLAWLTPTQRVRCVEYRDLKSGAAVTPTKEQDLEAEVAAAMIMPSVTLDDLRSEVFTHLKAQVAAGRGADLGLGNQTAQAPAQAPAASSVPVKPAPAADAVRVLDAAPVVATPRPVSVPLSAPGGQPGARQAQPTTAPKTTPAAGMVATVVAAGHDQVVTPPAATAEGRTFTPERAVDTAAPVTANTAHAVLLLRRGETIEQALGRLHAGACPSYIGLVNQVRHQASGKGTGYLTDGSKVFLAAIDTTRVPRGSDVVPAVVLGHVAWNGTGKDNAKPTVWCVGADPATYQPIAGEAKPVINVAGLSADKIAAAVGPNMGDKLGRVETWRTLQAFAGFPLGVEHTTALVADAWRAADPDFNKPQRERLVSELANRALDIEHDRQGQLRIRTKDGASVTTDQLLTLEQQQHLNAIIGQGDTAKQTQIVDRTR